MVRQWFLSIFLLFCVLRGINGQGNPPPTIKGSYKATGEMVETLEDESQMLTQIAFEESYDSENEQAAFRVWLIGQNLTFVENLKTKQTFQFNGTDCTLETMEEWIKTKSPPSLLGYEDTNGTVRFSLKQLFALDNKYLKEYNVSSTFRGMPARKWMYEIRGQDPVSKRTNIINVYAYWSDGSWKTTSSDPIVPLGYIVTRMNYTRDDPKFKVHEQFINVFGFTAGYIDPKLFEPIQGVICQNRSKTLEFPNVNRMQAVAIHSELVLPDELEIRYVDTWLDSKNKLLRMDMERIADEVPIFEEKSRKYQMEVAIADMGIVYRVTYDKGLFSCNVVPFKDFSFDIQNLFNFKLPKAEWEVAKLFGRNETEYVYIGKTYKRDIPCHMFQGLRKDWPEPSANVESIWEWCFSENMTKKDDVITFRNGEYGLVHAQAKVIKSGNQMFYPGLRMIHHFYDVNVKDPALMQATSFDISRCFTETSRRDLQFALDWMISDDNRHLAENATSDTTFLQKWKNAIYRFSGLESYTLRIAKVRATIIKNKLFIQFYILNPHPDLPSDIKKNQKTSFDLESALRENMNKGKVFVSYMPSKESKMLRLTALNHSLGFQINHEFKQHTLPPTESTAPTTPSKFPFTLETDPDDGKITRIPKSTKAPQSTPSQPTTGNTDDPKPTGTNQPTDNPGGSTNKPGKEEKPEEKVVHGPGTVAGVSIAMLLVGFSVGSAGIFVKMNGLPSCLKPSG